MTVGAVIVQSIPQDLRSIPQWIVWKNAKRNGKITKVPFDAKSGQPASVTDPDTWTTFDEAYTAFQTDPQWNGVGFVLTAEDEFSGVDLDRCIDEEGYIAAWAVEILDQLNTYCEISPSGKGIKAIVRGTLPEGRRRRGQIEMYTQERFFTITGDRCPDYPQAIHKRESELAVVHATHLGERERPEQEPAVTGSSKLHDEELVKRIRASEQAAKFERLWTGDISGYDSQSEADIALCNILAFWTDRDPDAIDRLFRQSDLYREKWERTTYRDTTISEAVAFVTETYQPNDGANLIFSNGKRHEPVSGTKRVDYPLTDTGNAERIVNRFGERIRYVTAWEQWLVYDGKRWVKDQSRQLERMAKAIARELHDEAGQIKDEKLKGSVTKFARKSESTAGKRNMIVSAQAEPGIVLDHGALDAQTYLLNTQSGTIDLRDGTLQPYSKLDYLSKITSSGYISHAACPVWESFLARIFDGDEELISYIQRAVGYSFTGATTEQVIFIMYGDGANGKSTFLNALMNLAGPYGRDTPAQTLYERNTDTIPNDLAALEGARIVSAFETDDRRSLSEGRVKQMTGGDRISARFMRAEWFEFVPQFKVWLATNHKPEIKGTDHAIWRRLRLIPFTVTIEADEIDPDLPAKLEAEAVSILKWIVEGARLWHEQGLEPTPKAVLAATQTYQEESDYVGMWIEKRCVLSPESQESFSDLYADFVSWSRTMNREPASQTRFGSELGRVQGLRKKRAASGVIYDGINLRQSATFNFD